MGCDVHMYVEKYNNNTKSWESVRGKFINPNTYAIERISRFHESPFGY